MYSTLYYHKTKTHTEVKMLHLTGVYGFLSTVAMYNLYIYTLYNLVITIFLPFLPPGQVIHNIHLQGRYTGILNNVTHPVIHPRYKYQIYLTSSTLLRARIHKIWLLG